MDWSQWPQWLVIFWLVGPVMFWPVFRVAGFANKKTWVEWFGGYIAVVTGRCMIAFVLHQGGFWS